MNKEWLRGIIKKKNIYKDVFNSPSGKIVLADLMKRCGVNRVSLESNEAMQFNNGKRSVGLYVMNTLNQPMDKLIEQIENMEQMEDVYDGS